MYSNNFCIFTFHNNIVKEFCYYPCLIISFSFFLFFLSFREKLSDGQLCGKTACGESSYGKNTLTKTTMTVTLLRNALKIGSTFHCKLLADFIVSMA